VERTAWTDERLDDLSNRVDRGFEQVDRRFDQVDRRFEETNRRFDSLGSELRTEIDSLRVTILRVGGGMMVGLVGVIAAVLARGV
jgi:hypothetical protein